MDKIIWQPAFITALGMALLTLTFFGVAGGTHAVTPWFTHGALLRDQFLQGEWWRILTAATLHADFVHVSSNAFFFLILGWAAAEHLGPGVMLLTWLLSAVLGFAASLISSHIFSTVGASGGLFGLLGAAGAHSFKHVASDPESTRLSRLRSYGAAILLLAMTAFNPHANLQAHLAGFAAGAVFGLTAPMQPASNAKQVFAALVTAIALVTAWWKALHTA